MMKTAWFIILLLVGAADATTYKSNVTLGAADFFGVCDSQKVEGLNIEATGECIGNFLNPAVPSPLIIISPVMGDNFKTKLDSVQILPYDASGNLNFSHWDILSSMKNLINSPIILAYTAFEVVIQTVKFILVFVFKFILVYVLYISLGFQALMNLANSSYEIENPTKIQGTFLIIAVATIFTLSYGGGWITWH